MRVSLIFAAISFSAAAFAQSAPPRIGDKPLVQVKPKGPTEPSEVSTAQSYGLTVWSELRGSISVTETQSLSERATALVSPVRTSDCLDQRRPPDLLT
jgi:hypothetical protein